MNLTQLIDAVYVETNRPDLVDETQAKVLAATQYLHYREHYMRDIQESRVAFEYCTYLQSLTTDALPFFRDMCYVRKCDDQSFDQGDSQFSGQVSNNGAGVLPPLWPTFLDWGNKNGLLAPVDAGDLLDTSNNNFEKTDVYYRAGNSLQMKSSTAFQFARIGFYTKPNLATGFNFNSWIADDYPYAIIFRAAGNILRTNGQQADALNYIDTGPQKTGLAQEQERMIDMTEVVIQGR